MNIICTCPCCSDRLLHHFSHHKDYWYCPSCRQEMPNLAAIKSNDHQKKLRDLRVLSF